MNITMRQLKVFQSVARHLSFTRAAAELFLTQPAVSMQVRQLEDTLGLPLFEQIGKKIFLTEAGREMVRYSRGISQQIEEIAEVFDQLRGVQRGTLRLSVPGTANHFVTKLLAEFCQRHAQITFNLDIANRKGLLDRLENNEADVVIMGKPPEEMDLVSDRFMDNPLVVIAQPGDALTKRTPVPLAELMQNSFVVREVGSGTRSAMERFFAEHGVTLKASMEMASNEAIKQAVAAGLGLGIVSVHTLELELALQRVAVIDCEAFPIMRHWYIVHRRGKRLSPIAEAFKAFVIGEAARLWPLGQATAPPAAGARAARAGTRKRNPSARA
ncbi:MAG: LysR substrate-binding domain-containing protein [Gammaproteobacteria bacterium]